MMSTYFLSHERTAEYACAVVHDCGVKQNPRDREDTMDAIVERLAMIIKGQGAC